MSLDALFAAVYDAPADDRPRLALADELSRVGDPRGDFIRRQCSRQPTKPTTSTKPGNEDLAAWLGPLRPLLVPQMCVFERGFVAVAALQAYAARSDALAAEPAWSTVREIRTAPDGGDWEPLALPLVQSPHAKSLRRVRYLPESAFFAMTSGAAPPLGAIESVGVRFVDLARAREALPRTLEAFPSAKELVVLGLDREMRPNRWLDVVTALPPVEHVGLHGPALLVLGEWMEALRATPLLRFDFTWGPNQIVVRRAAIEAPFDDLAITIPTRRWNQWNDLTDTVRLALLTVPSDAVTALSLSLGDEGLLAPAHRKRMEEAFARFPGAHVTRPYERRR